MSERWEELEDLYSKGLMNQVYDALQEINWSCRGCCKRVNYMRAYLCNDCFEVRS